MKKLWIVVVCFGFMACGAKKVAVQPALETTKTPTETEMNSAQLSMGKGIYESKCITCHSLKNPSDFTMGDLQQIVPAMVAKANGKGAQLSDMDRDLILEYMLSQAKDR